MFLVCLILNLLLSPVNADGLLPFDIVSKQAEQVISRMEQGKRVSPEVAQAACLALIDHVMDNLGKQALIRQDATLFISEADKKHSSVYPEINLRVIETESTRIFNKSFYYLKKLPIEFWGEQLLARLDMAAYSKDIDAKSDLGISYQNISFLNVMLELSEYNNKKTLPKPLLDFFGHYYYNHHGMKLSAIVPEDDIATLQEHAEALTDDLRILMADITASYAREVLLNGFSSNGCLNDDIEKLSLEIDFELYFGDINIHRVLQNPSKEALMETINSASVKIYFDFDLLHQNADLTPAKTFNEKIAEMKKSNAKTVKINVLDKINEYLPEHLRANDIKKAMDNFALYVSENLNGQLGLQEDILLFGEYTQVGRVGGIYNKMKAMNDVGLVALFGVLAYANELCDTRDVSSSVYSGFKMAGLTYNTGSINRDKLNPKDIQRKLQIRFSPAMMEMYKKGFELIRM